MAALVLVASVWPITTDWLVGRAAFDHLHFHLPAIERFATDWPQVDLTDYASATTPGYHLVIAFAGRTLGLDPVGLRWVGMLFSLALMGVVAWSVTRWSGSPRTGIVVSLPLICSMYVYSSAIWLLPDNAGWLGVWLVLAMTLHAPILLGRWLLLGLAASALVFTRQVHLWVLAPMIAAAWLDAQRLHASDRNTITPALSLREVRGVFSPTRSTMGSMVMALSVCLPAIAVVVVCAMVWGGLVPPQFQKFHTRHWSLASPAFFCSLFAGFGMFFVAYWWRGLRELLVSKRGVLLLSALFGLFAAVFPQTDYNFEQGRYGALWSVVRALPAVEHRSLLICVLAPVGSIIIASWLVLLDRRDRWVLMSACAGFMAAGAANTILGQRYFEPMVLILCALFASRQRATAYPGKWDQRARLLGPLALAFCLAALSAVTLSRSGTLDYPQQPWGTKLLTTPTTNQPSSVMIPESMKQSTSETPPAESEPGEPQLSEPVQSEPVQTDPAQSEPGQQDSPELL